MGKALPKLIVSKRDLHDYLVRKYAQNQSLHKKDTEVEQPAVVEDRIKIKQWVGGSDSLNHRKYYPGVVTEVNIDETYNLFLDDGTRMHDVRRDQFVFEYEEELPTPRSANVVDALVEE